MSTDTSPPDEDLPHDEKSHNAIVQRLRRGFFVGTLGYVFVSIAIGGVVFWTTQELIATNAQLHKADQTLKEKERELAERAADINELDRQIAEKVIKVDVLNQEVEALIAQKEALISGLNKLSSDAGRIDQLKRNSAITIFLHYRDDVPYSSEFAETAAQRLKAEGYAVPAATESSPNVRANDTPTGGSEGPRVDWFAPPNNPAAQRAALARAEEIKAILNDIRPNEFSKFEPNNGGWPSGAGPDQEYYLGVWF